MRTLFMIAFLPFHGIILTTLDTTIFVLDYLLKY